MPQLFAPARIGAIELRNRLVHSATYENMAHENGQVSESMLGRYAKLAKGEVGLIIPGHMFVHPHGKAQHGQTGIHSDDMIPGLAQLAQAVHDENGKIVFQLNHGGRQAPHEVMGRPPLAPSSFGRDPISLNKPKAATLADIEEAVASFGRAAGRAQQAGADGVQIHCAHGYLLSEFLSPFFNRRKDEYGGSDENRFRIVREIVSAIRSQVGKDYPILVKLNTTDYTPRPGLVPELAAKYVAWLGELGISAVELSGGTYHSYGFRMCRGDIPVDALKQGLPWWMKTVAAIGFKQQKKLCVFKAMYHLEAARVIKPVIGNMKLMLVGGVRTVADMERVLDEGTADFFSMSRPFIRQPNLAKRMREGKASEASCISCNMCLAAVFTGHPVACYTKGLPRV